MNYLLIINSLIVVHFVPFIRDVVAAKIARLQRLPKSYPTRLQWDELINDRLTPYCLNMARVQTLSLLFEKCLLFAKSSI